MIAAYGAGSPAVDRLDQVAELPRRGDGEEHVAGAPAKRAAREQAARHGHDLRAFPPLERGEPEGQADVVRGAVAARDNAPTRRERRAPRRPRRSRRARSSVARSDAGSSVRSRQRPVSSSTGAEPIQRSAPPAARRRRCRRRRTAEATSASSGAAGYASSGRNAASTRSRKRGRRAEPAAEHDQLRVERVREHREHAAPARPPRRRRARRDAGSASTSSARSTPAAGASARPLATRSTGGAPSVIACPRAPAYGSPSTTRHALAPVPTITNRNGERSRPGPEARLGERRRPHVRLEHDPGSRDRAGKIETAPVDRVGARRPAVERRRARTARCRPAASPPEPRPPARRSPSSTAAPPRSGRVGTCRRSSTRPLATSTSPAAIFVPPTSMPTAQAHRGDGLDAFDIAL